MSDQEVENKVRADDTQKDTVAAEDGKETDAAEDGDAGHGNKDPGKPVKSASANAKPSGPVQKRSATQPRKRREFVDPASAGHPAQSAYKKRRKNENAEPLITKEDEKKAAEEMMGIGAVVKRNAFYRDGYRNFQRLVIMQSAIIAGLIMAHILFIHVHQPENRYFATTEDGRLIQMVPLNVPNLSTPALMSWVAQSATEVMTFGFHDYKRRLQEASRNFTRRGWGSFTKALENSRIMETVVSNNQVVTAAPRSSPILISEGTVNGRYQWVVELPLNVTYQSGSKTRSDNLVVTLVIVRVSKLESPNGLGIEQWIAQYG